MSLIDRIKSWFTPIKLATVQKYPERTYNTTNYTSGVAIQPRGVVFHHSCGSWAGDIAWIMNPTNPAKGIYASYHCLIKQDGERAIFGDDTKRMWHAGASSWKGMPCSCNSYMLGCAFSGSTYPEDRFGAPLNRNQIESAIEWLEPRWRKWKFSMPWITDHRQVSPGRKNDLNPMEWVKLFEAIEKKFKSAY